MTDKPTDAVAQARAALADLRQHAINGWVAYGYHQMSREKAEQMLREYEDALIAAVRAECAAKHITLDVVESAYAEGYEDAESDPENCSAFRIARGWKSSRVYSQLTEAP